MTLDESHFDISGKLCKLMHPENIALILITLEVSHLEISFKEIKEEHPLKIRLKFIKLLAGIIRNLSIYSICNFLNRINFPIASWRSFSLQDIDIDTSSPFLNGLLKSPCNS